MSRILIWINDAIKLEKKLFKFYSTLEKLNYDVHLIANKKSSEEYLNNKGFKINSIETIIEEEFKFKNLFLIKSIFLDSIPDSLKLSILATFDYKKITLPKILKRNFEDINTLYSILNYIWDIILKESYDNVFILNGLDLNSYILSEKSSRLKINKTYWENGLLKNSLFIDKDGVNAYSNFAQKTYKVRRNQMNEDKSKISDLSNFINKIKNKENNIKNILVTLQVDRDSNIKCFSPFYSVSDFLTFLEEHLIKNLSHIKFYLRAHPKNIKSINHCSFLKKSYKNVNLSYEANVLDDLKRTDLVLTINSTTGFEAIEENIPLIAFGKSLYSNYISKYHLVSNDLNLEFYYFDNNLNSNSIKLLKKNLIDTSLILDESKKEWERKLLYYTNKINFQNKLIEDLDTQNQFFYSKKTYFKEPIEIKYSIFKFRLKRFILKNYSIFKFLIK